MRPLFGETGYTNPVLGVSPNSIKADKLTDQQRRFLTTISNKESIWQSPRIKGLLVRMFPNVGVGPEQAREAIKAVLGS